MRRFPLSRRGFFSLASALTLAACAKPEVRQTPVLSASDGSISRIAFGSCAREAQPQPIWKAVLESGPEVFVFLGDNVYGDTEDMDVLRKKYGLLAKQAGFRKLKAQAAVVATWDDHDYGRDDAGAEYPMKWESKQIFLDFFNEPPETERRLRHGGIYTSYLWGPEGKRVQLILLDTRYDRTPLLKAPQSEREARRQNHMGSNRPNPDSAARILGDDQWAWLEGQLAVAADIRVIATSIPFVMEFTGTETWANFPLERRRLIDLVQKQHADGVFFISGDIHYGDISRMSADVPYPLWDVTSSALNQEPKLVAPNRHRMGDYTDKPNFGLITILWGAPEPRIRVELRNIQGLAVNTKSFRLSETSFPRARSR
ncbi:MAG: alkaline phosphatase family protein [Rhodospirillales bacterium]|nr:alkaline phosphatase family protein [Rhodospirillales bacterium]